MGFSWFAGAFGPCLHGCNDSPNGIRFRKVVCRHAANFSVINDSRCPADLKPQNFKNCPCVHGDCEPGKAMTCQTAVAATAASWKKFEPIGCLSRPPNATRMPDMAYAEEVAEAHDMTCEKWRATNESRLCSRGLPFFAFAEKNMNTAKCFRFCLQRGLDVFGRNADLCRCGASALNLAVWHREKPRQGLYLDPTLEEVYPTGSSNCKFQLFRYKGPFLYNGVVPLKLVRSNLADMEYVASIVAGTRIGQSAEEGSEDEHSRDAADQSTPGNQGSIKLRECYPQQCGAAIPWPLRVQNPPFGDSKRYQEYVVIHYTFDKGLDQDRKEVVRKAAEEYREVSCINFVEISSPTKPCVEIKKVNLGSCFAWLGYHGSKINSIMNLGFCNSMGHLGSVIHEFGHVLGMGHHQLRPDATKPIYVEGSKHGPYLKISWSEIGSRWMPQWLGNDDSYIGSAYDGPGDPHVGYAPYDYGSIMHYPATPGVETTNGEKLRGQRSGLSDGDIRQINDMYQCKLAPTPEPH